MTSYPSRDPIDFVEAGLKLIKTASLVTSSGDNMRELREFGVRQARLELHNRRRRDDYLPTHIFGEPGWVMMLELYISSDEQRPVPVTSLCAMSGEPQSTALRWIAILEQEGLVFRSDASPDKRVRIVSLSLTGLELLDDYFSSRKHHLL